MKSGSLIQLIDNDWSKQALDDRLEFNIKLPKLNVIYTVRDIIYYEERDMYGLTLEEIINPKILPYGNELVEPTFWDKLFVELVPSIDVNELLNSNKTTSLYYDSFENLTRKKPKDDKS